MLFCQMFSVTTLFSSTFTASVKNLAIYIQQKGEIYNIILWADLNA